MVSSDQPAWELTERLCVAVWAVFALGRAMRLARAATNGQGVVNVCKTATSPSFLGAERSRN